mgnify:CR=1 FL=1
MERKKVPNFGVFWRHPTTTQGAFRALPRFKTWGDAVSDRLISADEARHLLGGIGRTKFWSMIRTGELPKPLKLGTRSLWRLRDVQAFIDRLEAAGAAQGGGA